MAMTREDFYKRGYEAATDPDQIRVRGVLDTCPEFGQGDSWQAKAFAEGFRKGKADCRQSQCTHIRLSQGRCPVCYAGVPVVERVPVTINSPETGGDSVVFMRKSTVDKLHKIAEREKRRSKRVEQILTGYIDAALCSSGDGIDPESGEELESLEGFEVAESEREKLRKDCAKFYLAAGADLGAFVDLYPSRVSTEHDPWEAIGHDLWLTRNGHGAGFWSRDMGRVGERLTALCGYGKPFGIVTALLGDDGLVYFS